MANAYKNIDDLIISYKSCTEPKRRNALHMRIMEAGMEIVKRIAVSTASFQNVCPVEDLIQVGALGLIKSIDFYKYNKNAKFSTYSIYFIKGEINHYLRDKVALIRTPRKVQELIFKIYNATRELKEKNNSEPNAKQIAEYINLPVKKVEELMKVEQYKSMISLDQTIFSDNEEVSLMDKIPSHDYQEFWSSYEDKIMLETSIKKLNPELREILELSFYEELSQREISEKLNISQMQVSRRLKKALHQMYEIMKRN